MGRVLGPLVLAWILVPATAFAVAFEEHSSWQKEPRLETERGVSLGMSVLEMGTGFRMVTSEIFFNSQGSLQTALNSYEIVTFDVFWRFGFTENWTLWGNVPFIWSEQTEVDFQRTAYGRLGDSETGVIYQFFRRKQPTLSMGVQVRWKLPTGSETVGKNNRNITGTGTTDVELAYLGRIQIIDFLAIGWSVGYNIRFPGTVQYILDRNTQITNASLDLGDEIHGQLDLIGALDYLAVTLSARFTHRFATALAIGEYRAETVKWTNPTTGEEEEEEYLLYNGARFRDWSVLDAQGVRRSSAGYLFTLIPQLLIRPLDWFDISFYAQFHLAGVNSIYLMNAEQNNSTIDNFMPMQALGKEFFSMVLGEIGGRTTIRW